MKLITLKDAGRRLNPDKPLTRRHVDRLCAAGQLTKRPWPDAPRRDIKVGVSAHQVAALKRKRKRQGKAVDA